MSDRTRPETQWAAAKKARPQPPVAPIGAGTLRQLLDGTTAAVYVKDADGRYRYGNRHFFELVGVDPDIVMGHTDEAWLPVEAAAGLRRNDAAVLERGEEIEFEERLEIDGRAGVYLSRKFPLFDADGRPWAVCGISTDITGRKRTEEALRSIAVGVSAAVGDEVFEAIVMALARALEVDLALIASRPTDEDLASLAIWDRDGRMQSLQYPIARTPCERVIGEGFQYYSGDLLAHYGDDSLLRDGGYVSYAGYPLVGHEGQPLGVLAVCDRRPLPDAELVRSLLHVFSVRAAAEIERARIEQEQRISEESYRNIFEASGDAISVHDIETGALVDVNPAVDSLYGYTREELLGAALGSLSLGEEPYTAERIWTLFQRARAEPQQFEWRGRHKDGGAHWEEITFRRARIGGVDRMLAFAREVTERKAREQALARSEDRLRATMDAALDCIVCMDRDGRVVEFNPAAVDAFGYRREDVIGRPLAELIIPERHREAHRRGMRHYLESGEGAFIGQRVELSAMRADGSEFPIELAISVVQGAGGELFIGYLRDISERREAERERERLERQLRQAQKMEALGQLTGGIAHDFNNILTGVTGYVGLAEERAGSAGDERIRRYLAAARESAGRASDLIQQMLTFSRGERGEPRSLYPAAHLAGSGHLLNSTVPSSITLSIEAEPSCPSILADPVRLDQVLMNLCINARDALDGHGDIRVRARPVTLETFVCSSCRQAAAGRFVELSVADTGRGIPEEDRERLFEPFFSTKQAGRGSGMGLAIVHGIVHEYGGHLLVDANRPQGAVFRVLLPVEGEAGGAHAATATGAGAETGTAAARSLRGRVLLVEDEASVRGFMTELLEDRGLEVTAHGDPRAARAALADPAAGFDLAILDQTMPHLTGTELAAEARELRPGLPVLLYTGYAADLSEERARAAGVRAVLRKPLDVPRLARLLEQLLPQRND